MLSFDLIKSGLKLSTGIHHNSFASMFLKAAPNCVTEFYFKKWFSATDYPTD
jgi:hypothetical protein